MPFICVQKVLSFQWESTWSPAGPDIQIFVPPVPLIPSSAIPSAVVPWTAINGTPVILPILLPGLVFVDIAPSPFVTWTPTLSVTALTATPMYLVLAQPYTDSPPVPGLTVSTNPWFTINGQPVICSGDIVAAAPSPGTIVGLSHWSVNGRPMAQEGLATAPPLGGCILSGQALPYFSA